MTVSCPVGPPIKILPVLEPKNTGIVPPYLKDDPWFVPVGWDTPRVFDVNDSDEAGPTPYPWYPSRGV